jgi:predicted PurR-regulated permease PerM
MIVVTVLFFYTVMPLILPVAMGAILGVLFMPTLERMQRRGLSKELAASLLTFLITVLLLLPASVLLFIGIRATVQELDALKTMPRGGGDWVAAFLNTPKVHGFIVWITQWFPVDMAELLETADTIVRSVGAKLADLLAGSLTQIPGVVMGMVVAVVSVYFALVDGKGFLAFIRKHSVFTPVQTDRLIHNVALMCRGVILATVLSGTAQCLVEGLACMILGVPNVPLIITLVFLASFIPVVGSAPVTFAIAAQQLLNDRTGVGITLAVVALIVAGLDNLIRPLFLKGSGGLHPLLAFVSAFGGLQMMGFPGIFLGPVLAALFTFVLSAVIESPEKAIDAVDPKNPAHLL